MQVDQDVWPLHTRCAELMDRVCTSGRPFSLIQMRVVKASTDSAAGTSAVIGSGTGGSGESQWIDVSPGSGEVGELWVRGPTVFSGTYI